MDASWINYSLASSWYNKILNLFQFSESDDISARDLLFSYRKDSDPLNLVNNIKKTISSKQILFFGAGPNLCRHLTQIIKGIKKNRNKFFLVAADGSANALRIYNILPDIIISDLDGISYSEFQYFNHNNVIILIHGHGDNISKIKEYSETIQNGKNIICTTQNQSKYPIINPGGFTDGDRGIYFLHHIAPPQNVFWLFGYDFSGSIGPFSKQGLAIPKKMSDIKAKKMKIAKELILDITLRYQRDIQFYGENPITDLKIKFAITHGFEQLFA